MVIMGLEVYENTMHRFAVYKEIEVSEHQIETGNVIGAYAVLKEMRIKHGL